MKLFRCQLCGNGLHFDNRQCLNCGAMLGFDPISLHLETLEPDPEGTGFKAVGVPVKRFRFCSNAHYDVCNWLIPQQSSERLCLSCRHNHLIPDISFAQGLERWRQICRAQRYLVYSLQRFGLPHPNRIDDPRLGLEFNWLEDEIAPNGAPKPAMTGHMEGRINVRAAEADDLTREMVRHSLHEPNRTLVGHLRHESGHYYWDLLVRDSQLLERFREVFGDERADYDRALWVHYQDGPPPDWHWRYISPYAASHPWEDFAESFAHCLLIIDALETAQVYGMALRPPEHEVFSAEIGFDPYNHTDFETLAAAWVRLSLCVNGIHESLGERPLYPYLLSPTVVGKLGFVHDLIRDAAGMTNA